MARNGVFQAGDGSRNDKTMTSKAKRGSDNPPKPPDRQYLPETAEPAENLDLPDSSGPRRYIQLETAASIDPAESLATVRPLPVAAPRVNSVVHDAMTEHAREANYQIGERLARGAESVLYRTAGNGAAFCVKVIRNWLGRTIGDAATRGNEGKLDAAYHSKVRHLRNEYEVGQQLQEPGDIPIVRIYALRKVRRLGIEVGYDLLMELIEGDDLGSKQALRQYGLPEKVSFFYQAAKALDYMHQRNFIHLDIKPSNIMIDKNRVKLIDFGVTVPLGHKPRSVTGTAGYLSPEQIARDILNQATDIFALGVAFQVIFGGSPLRQDPADLKRQDFRANARFMLETDEAPIVRSVPELKDLPELGDLIRQCTVPRRDKRIGNAGELAEAIRRAAEAAGLTVRA